jgi:hypothetical protein
VSLFLVFLIFVPDELQTPKDAVVTYVVTEIDTSESEFRVNLN